MNMLAVVCSLSLHVGCAGSWAAPVARDPADLERAERAYRAGDFQQAHALYTAALQAGDVPRGAVLFHLGNCAYRLGQRAEAIWCYRRALLRLPRDPEVRGNLRLVEAQLGVEPPPSSLGSALRTPLEVLTQRELLALASVLQAGGLLGFLTAQRRNARRGMALLVALGLGCGAHLLHRTWLAAPSHAVVLDHGGTLHAQAEASTKPLLTLRAGEALSVESIGEQWLEVTHALSHGFVERARVGLVEDPR